MATSTKTRFGEVLGLARGAGRAVGAAAKGSSVEVLVQLDHARDEPLIERAAGYGLDAVMADGSKLPFAKNLAFTRAVAGETLSGAMTDPDEAEKFSEESGVDCLAVAVGNVHGHYSGTPNLDWER